MTQNVLHSLLQIAEKYTDFEAYVEYVYEKNIFGMSNGANKDLLALVWDFSQARDFKKIRNLSGMTQQAFADCHKIPKRSIENWEGAKRTPPDYLVEYIFSDLLTEKFGII